MRRIASHYVYYRQLHRMSYVELTEGNLFSGVYPLEEEIAGTEFYDGILVPIASGNTKLLPEQIEPGTPVRLFLLNAVTLTATELPTDNSRGNSHIERL